MLNEYARTGHFSQAMEPCNKHDARRWSELVGADREVFACTAYGVNPRVTFEWIRQPVSQKTFHERK